MAVASSLRNQWAPAFVEGLKRLVARDRRQNFIVVPRTCRFSGGLHLNEIHIMDEPAVFAHLAIGHVEI